MIFCFVLSQGSSRSEKFLCMGEICSTSINVMLSHVHPQSISGPVSFMAVGAGND